MSGELHAISQAIGRLEALAESAQNDSENIWRVINQIRDSQQEALRKLDAVVRMEERLQKVEKQASDTAKAAEAWKNRSVGAIAVLSVISGVLGAFVPPVVKAAWARLVG